MDGKKYRKLKYDLNKRQKYFLLKEELLRRCNKYDFSDNMFELIEIMRTGNKLLKMEKFPTKEFLIYATGKSK
jgi:hypothetical protein